MKATSDPHFDRLDHQLMRQIMEFISSEASTVFKCFLKKRKEINVKNDSLISAYITFPNEERKIMQCKWRLSLSSESFNIYIGLAAFDAQRISPSSIVSLGNIYIFPHKRKREKRANALQTVFPRRRRRLASTQRALLTAFISLEASSRL
jgi:hypothetical protein